MADIISASVTVVSIGETQSEAMVMLIAEMETVLDKLRGDWIEAEKMVTFKTEFKS
jgi:hypothetical protein